MFSSFLKLFFGFTQAYFPQPIRLLSMRLKSHPKFFLYSFPTNIKQERIKAPQDLEFDTYTRELSLFTTLSHFAALVILGMGCGGSA